MKNLRLGLLILFLLGFIGWILNGILGFIDQFFQTFLGFFLPENLIFTGSGLILALISAYLLGKFLRSKSVEKHLGPILSHIPLVKRLWKFGKTAQMSLEELKTMPRVWVNYRGEGRSDPAFLREIEELRIKNLKGETVKRIIKVHLFVPSSNNPTTGSVPSVRPEDIEAVIDNEFMEVLNYIISCSAIKPAKGWKLREFKVEEFANLKSPTS